MNEYTCSNCGKIFKRYKSQVVNELRVCCSKKCYSELSVKIGLMKGKNNPRYKHGIHCSESYCECGNIKDYRSKICSKCSKSGFAKKDALSYIIDDNLILETVLNSTSLQDLARKTGYSRTSVTKLLKKYNVDLSHFVASRGRDARLEKIFITSSSRTNGTLIRYILKYNLIPYICSSCGIGNTYNGKKLRLQLHHVNGNSFDNNLNNLQILCPNCHSQTDTYCRSNANKPINLKKNN